MSEKYWWLILAITITIAAGTVSYKIYHDHVLSETFAHNKKVTAITLSPNKIKPASKQEIVTYGPGVPILMYHSVSISANRLCIPPQKLDQQFTWLQQNGFNTITMKRLLYSLNKHQALPSRAIVLTFDDGYRDNYDQAFPLLQKHHMVATIFLMTAKIGTAVGLTPDQIKHMQEYGIEFGSHTVHHVDLRYVSAAGLISEIQGSKHILENILGEKVVSFSYPSGKYTAATIQAVKDAGFEGAVTTAPGKIMPNYNVYLLPRVRVNGDESLSQFIASINYKIPPN